MAKYAGTKVRINEEEYVIPSLSLGQLRNGALEQLREHDRLVTDGKFFEAVTIRAEIILLALRRNYPDFEEDELFDYLDLDNSGPVWNAVLGISGFTPGETQAATTATETGISAPSTEA